MDDLMSETFVHDGKRSCCGGVHPEHRPRCRKLAIRDGDLHLNVPDGDTITHSMSPECPCGPQRVELYASLANPNWKGCGWSHRAVGSS